MDTNIIISKPEMNFKLVKRKDLLTVLRGKPSPLSELLVKLQAMKDDEAVVIETEGTVAQRLVYQRMRANIQKWKVRYGLKKISVHLTQDGNVALFHDK